MCRPLFSLSTKVDLEDLGVVVSTGKAEVAKEELAPKDRPEMVTPLQRKSLEKEGYDIIGTHSAVKLCRWTKHQLRGRGGCYKHTCYGIVSYQCMEATPSLACANKYVLHLLLCSGKDSFLLLFLFFSPSGAFFAGVITKIQSAPSGGGSKIHLKK